MDKIATILFGVTLIVVLVYLKLYQRHTVQIKQKTFWLIYGILYVLPNALLYRIYKNNYPTIIAVYAATLFLVCSIIIASQNNTDEKVNRGRVSRNGLQGARFTYLFMGFLIFPYTMELYRDRLICMISFAIVVLITLFLFSRGEIIIFFNKNSFTIKTVFVSVSLSALLACIYSLLVAFYPQLHVIQYDNVKNMNEISVLSTNLKMVIVSIYFALGALALSKNSWLARVNTYSFNITNRFPSDPEGNKYLED